MIGEPESERINRREFFQTTALVAGVSGLSAYAGDSKSRVIEVHRPGIIGENNRPDPEGTQEMLDRAMRELTGERSRRDQWSRFVSADDVVGLKVNGLGGPHLCTKQELVKAVIHGLLDAGVKENNIIVWDNNDGHVRAIGLEFNTGKVGFRVYSSHSDAGGHDETEIDFGAGSACLSKILTEQITALINMPIIKDHDMAGTTLSMKNLSHGITENPGPHHDNGCDPYIAQINAIPVVGEKHRLVVLDGLRGCYDGGPSYKESTTYNYESILVSTDRLAIDTIGTEKIEAARRAKGVPALDEARHPPRYLATAAQLGLGQSDRTQIEHRMIEG
ncbi:MAG: DUF362 domain-containing protein [bacterium]